MSGSTSTGHGWRGAVGQSEGAAAGLSKHELKAAIAAMQRVSGARAGSLLHVRELTEFSTVAEEHSSVWQQGQVAHLRNNTMVVALLRLAHSIF